MQVLPLNRTVRVVIKKTPLCHFDRNALAIVKRKQNAFGEKLLLIWFLSEWFWLCGYIYKMVSPGCASAASLKQRLLTDETWLKILFKLNFLAYFSFVIFIVTLRGGGNRKKATFLDPHTNLSSHSTIVLIPPEYSNKYYATAIYWQIKPVYFFMLFYSSERRESTGETDGYEEEYNIRNCWCSDRDKVVIQKR